MSEPLFGFTPVELVAFDTVQEQRPAILSGLRERLAPVLSDLALDCQGLITT